MPREYRAQIHRDNPRKPSVVRGAFFGWQARGYDRHSLFHTKSLWTWEEALEIALEWARDGYPEEAPEVAA